MQERGSVQPARARASDFQATEVRAPEVRAACAAPAAAGEKPGGEGQSWERLGQAILSRIPREQFETWFRRARLDAVEDGRVRIAFQNEFSLNWVNSHYRTVLERSISDVFGPDHALTLSVDPELALRPGAASTSEGDAGDRACAPRPSAPDPNRAVTRKNGSTAHAPAGMRGGLLQSSDVTLNARYVFDQFVVGPCNRLAHAAAVGVSERPGTQYNPFFLHGSVGLGKTHLLQSLCHALIERSEGVRILYLSCESFVNHFISALENGDLQKFRNKYRNVDVLVVDDIHLLANKERTQEEFFHTFNTLYLAGKQIVLSSDSPPKDIPTLQDRLVSRFKWGLVTEIEQPCYETRMAILKRKSKDRGHELPDEVARVLAEHIDTNIRELEGAVTKLLGYASLCKRPVDVPLAHECLRDVFASTRGNPSMEDILRELTQHFNVKLSELQSRKRTNAIAFPRQVGMFLARRLTRMSLEEIGGYFGGRDHSTVLYGVQKMTDLSSKDPEVAALLVELESVIKRPGI